MQGALDQVFAGNSGTSETGASTGSGKPTTGSADLASALANAKQAFADGQAALAKGDFAAYGKAQDRLKAAIAAAISAQSKK